LRDAISMGAVMTMTSANVDINGANSPVFDWA
jgi:hypothetical protein